MQNLTGAIAEGNDFFGREAEMKDFWQLLQTANLLLLAPRRVGKSSVMKKMKENSGRYTFTSVYVDVCDCGDEQGFVHRLCKAIFDQDCGDHLWSRIKESPLGKTMERVQKIGVAGCNIEFRQDAGSWKDQGEELAHTLSGLEGRWLLQVDELPVFVLGLLGQGSAAERQRVKDFLYWMRRLRLQYRPVRWLLAGSIGLDTVAARLNIGDAINDLQVKSLGACDGPTAHELLRALAKSYQVPLSDSVRRRIVDRAGWPIPFYLQLIFSELRGLTDLAAESDVDRAIESLLAHGSYFDYWRQRLFEELGKPDADHALALLHHACRSPAGSPHTTLSLALAKLVPDVATREDKMRYLLGVLRNDGYLVEEDYRWRFQSPLLREYWQRRVAPQEAAHA